MAGTAAAAAAAGTDAGCRVTAQLLAMRQMRLKGRLLQRRLKKAAANNTSGHKNGRPHTCPGPPPNGLTTPPLNPTAPTHRAACAAEGCCCRAAKLLQLVPQPAAPQVKGNTQAGVLGRQAGAAAAAAAGDGNVRVSLCGGLCIAAAGVVVLLPLLCEAACRLRGLLC